MAKEYLESLYRPSTVGRQEQTGPTAIGDSSEGRTSSTGPLLYTSAPVASVAATRMQVTSQPLAAGGHTDANLKFSRRDKLRLVIALVVTALYLALLVLMLMLGSSPPDLGYTVRRDPSNQLVVTHVVPYSLSYDRGLRPGDVLIKESGEGLTLTSTFARGGDLSRTIMISPESGAALSALQRWSFILLALIFIGVGAPVYVKARQRTAAAAFYIFCIASAVALAVGPSAYLGYAWGLALTFLSIVVWAGSFAFFFFKFPVKIGKTRRRHDMLVGAVLAGGALVSGAYLWTFVFDPSLYDVTRSMNYVYLVGCIGAGLFSLAQSLLTEHSPEVRQQMAILLGGTALAVGPSLLLGILPTLLGLPHIPIDVTVLSLGFMPMSFAYAIVQHQLLGVRNFVRRGLVYVLMGFGVLIALSMSVVTISSFIPNNWQSQEISLISFSLVAFVVALSYGYAQRWVERLVDKYIYHDAYDYKEALLQFSAQLAAEQNLHTLADELVQRTCRMMNLSCGVLLLANQPQRDDAPITSGLLYRDMTSDMFDMNALWSRAADQVGAFPASLISDPQLSLQDSAPAVAVAVAPPPPMDDGPNDGLLRVVPYARYGDCSKWLVDGLQYELSQLGIRLDDANAPMQILYFGNETNGADLTTTTHLRAEMLGLGRGWGHTPARGYDMRNGTGPLELNGNGNGNGAEHTDGNGYRTEESPRSFLGVPLWTRNRFVGVLCLGGKRTGERFTRDDLSLLSTLGSQAALAIYNAQLYEAREQALLDTIAALAHAIEAKDGYTIQHCEKMTGRALALAQAMDLSIEEIENIRMGAILHDIGKIGIPDAVLNKPGRLTPEEYELMKQHAAIGARIVQSVGALQGVVPIVRYHQERYDGSGYPEGLKGETIPIGARIIGVVDTYGAMTEDRIYRPTPGHDAAIAELKRLSGRQFDPAVVKAFIELLDERPDLAEVSTTVH
ncbi:MAG TPA: HD domain-containing phosphohydrolase [Chloroflexia bacterium]|nr:HD domain-containing phosphohydrolase [Chloroflexia bacterium]